MDAAAVLFLGIPAAFEWAVVALRFWVQAENYEMMETSNMELSGPLSVKLGDYASVASHGVFTGVPMPCHLGTKVTGAGVVAVAMPFATVGTTCASPCSRHSLVIRPTLDRHTFFVSQ